jgi:hypothetical protein
VLIPFVLRTRFPAALGAAMLLPLVAAADVSGSARVSTGVGFDSNVRRDYDQIPGGTQADGFAFASGWGHLQINGDKGRAWGEYELGLRKFFQSTGDDVVVQSLAGQGVLPLSQLLGFGLDLRGKDRRGGDRDYTDLAAFAFVELIPAGSFDLRAEAGAQRFIYRPIFEYSFKATDFSVQARYRFDRHHSIALLGELDLRFYNGDARPNPSVEANSFPQRQDTAFLSGLSYSYRGPFALTLSYSYGGAISNSFGETVYRHRFSANAGMSLPWELTLLAQGAVQLAHYPDGANTPPQLILLEDDNQNSVALKLLRPLSTHLDGELRFALYHANLPQNGLTYLRQVAWIGITWRL